MITPSAKSTPIKSPPSKKTKVDEKAEPMASQECLLTAKTLILGEGEESQADPHCALESLKANEDGDQAMPPAKEATNESQAEDASADLQSQGVMGSPAKTAGEEITTWEDSQPPFDATQGTPIKFAPIDLDETRLKCKLILLC